MTDLYYLSQVDGVGEWREKEAKDLSALVQNRITYLQVMLNLLFSQLSTMTHTQKSRTVHTKLAAVSGSGCGRSSAS